MPRGNLPGPNPLTEKMIELLRKVPGAETVGSAIETMIGPENPPVHMVLQAMNRADPTGLMSMGMPIGMAKITPAVAEARAAGKVGVKLTEARRNVLFDRAAPANEPIRDLQHWEKGPLEYWRPGETQMVPVKELEKLREFERGGVGANPGSAETIQALEGNVEAYGLGSPMMINYWAPDKKAIIGEGNHRLAAAIRSGIEELPARVYGNNFPVGRRDTAGGRRPPVNVPGTSGHGAGELSPTDIGIPARAMTPEEAALNGKKVRVGYPKDFRTDARKRADADRQFTELAGGMRDAEDLRRNPQPPVDAQTQKLFDLLGW